MTEDKDINGMEEYHHMGDSGKGDSFDLPEDYFDSFSAKVFNRLEIQDEISEFETLSSISKEQVFDVPLGYFERLSEKTECKDELVPYTNLFGLKGISSFQIPENYFESLSATTLNRIAISEELNNFTALLSIEKQHNFTVPEEYFDTLAEKVKDKLIEAKGSRVIDLVLVFLNKKIAYSIAAVLVIGLFLFYFVKADESITAKSDCTTLACVEKKEIINSNYVKGLDEESLIDMVDVKALSDTLAKQHIKSEDKAASDFVIENS
ncbi:MAG TPA: hypothetical protein VNX68_17790, partial [Nitrosopumilaceae archaeon]|nr:hypothetical protein [Nitrosopumilaceae archaeon]